MSHIPYGYRIENGRAVIDEEKAEQVRKLYKGYLSGLAYMPAVEAERVKRQARLGRVFDEKPGKVSNVVTGFTIPKVQIKYEDPIKQAEYVYSLIESEVNA